MTAPGGYSPPRLVAEWPGVLARASRVALAETLAAYARSRRWFRAKTRALRSARIADVVPLDERRPAEAAHGGALLVVLELGYDDDGPEMYVVPVAFAAAERARRLASDVPHAVIAWLDGTAGMGALVDALATGEAGPALLALARDEQVREGDAGRIVGYGSDNLRTIAGEGPLPVKVPSAEQSNSNVVLGGRVLLKIYRRLAEGPNPELELGTFLTAHPRRPPVPRILGSLLYRDERGGEHGLSVVHEFLTNDGDAWSRALRELGQLFDGAASAEATARGLARGQAAAAKLGHRTGDVHLALFEVERLGGAPDPSFTPAPLTREDRAAAVARADAMLRRTLGELPGHLGRVPEALRAEVRGLLEPGGPERARIAELLARFRDEPLDVLKTRIHGDLHLGQVLCRGDDYVIIDFEGEPGRSLHDRRAKDSPLRDVVGMLRSYDYAPEAVLRAGAPRSGRSGALGELAVTWKRQMTSAFLRGYLERVGEARFLPRAREAPDDPRSPFSLMLRFYELERVVYEVEYELNNRPDWLDIPLRGMCALARGERTP